MSNNNQNILVVKLGGGEGLDVAASCADLAQIASQRRLVIVHGVSRIMNEMCSTMGVEIQTLTSPTGHASRYTTPQVRDIYVQAATRANYEIVENLWLHNINAVGISQSEYFIHGQRKEAIRAVVNGRVRIVRDDYSGSITTVDAARIRELLDAGYTPVLPPMAISNDGFLNVDGDRASAAVAGSLHADELIILSNVRGLFRNYPDESSIVHQVSRNEINSAMNWAQGRMKRKVLGAQEAIESGVSRVIIGDGRIQNPVQQALAGAGTVFTS